MTTLSLDKNLALKIYPTASEEVKLILESSFGKPFFSMGIKDRIKTFEDACEVLNINLEEFVKQTSTDSIDVVAYKKLKIIIAALNEGWQPNWEDYDQYKWYCWFKMDGGFCFDGAGCNSTSSSVGSRLCFKSDELASYAGKQFEQLYKDFLTINQ